MNTLCIRKKKKKIPFSQLPYSIPFNFHIKTPAASVYIKYPSRLYQIILLSVTTSHVLPCKYTADYIWSSNQSVIYIYSPGSTFKL